MQEERAMKKTGAVLVAAGLSSRMKDFKPMLPFGGSTVSRHMVSMLKDMDIDHKGDKMSSNDKPNRQKQA